MVIITKECLTFTVLTVTWEASINLVRVGGALKEGSNPGIFHHSTLEVLPQLVQVFRPNLGPIAAISFLQATCQDLLPQSLLKSRTLSSSRFWAYPPVSLAGVVIQPISSSSSEPASSANSGLEPSLSPFLKSSSSLSNPPLLPGFPCTLLHALPGIRPGCLLWSVCIRGFPYPGSRYNYRV